MFKNYLKTAMRQLRRDKLSAFVNIAGLAVAMASVMVIAGYVWYEWGFDRQFPEGEQIYRVTYDETVSRTDGRHLATVSPPMGPALAERYPEVAASVRVRYTDEVLMVKDEHRFFENGLVYADSLFLNFSLSHLQKVTPKQLWTSLIRWLLPDPLRINILEELLYLVRPCYWMEPDHSK